MTAITTCQICARAIKAKTGVIAHHGYRRPHRGSGWQTASCMGARHRPYEVACDALPPAIASCKRYLQRREGFLHTFREEPPATLQWDQTDAWGKVLSTHTFTRPDTFDVAKKSFEANIRKSYEYRFRTIESEAASDIAGSRESLAYLEKRHADWKAPADAQ